MKSILLAVALALSVYGCGTLGGLTDPLHAPVTIEESASEKAVRVAHEAIDEANAALTAVNQVITDNVVSGVWTKAQAQSALDRSKIYGKDVDDAREALRVGDVFSAKSGAEITRTLILMFHKEIAAQARKE